MSNQDENFSFRIQPAPWNGFGVTVLRKVKECGNVVHYYGMFDVDGNNCPFDLYAPRPQLSKALGSEREPEITFHLFPSFLPVRETGYIGEQISLSVDTETWEYELTQRREHAVHSWIYDTWHGDKLYVIYVPKKLMEGAPPPAKIMTGMTGILSG